MMGAKAPVVIFGGNESQKVSLLSDFSQYRQSAKRRSQGQEIALRGMLNGNPRKGKRMDSNYYVILGGWMVQRLKLRENDLIIYAIIYGCSQDGESVYRGGDEYLAYASGLSPSTVRKILKRLMEKGLIVKSQEIVGDELLDRYSVAK